MPLTNNVVADCLGILSAYLVTSGPKRNVVYYCTNSLAISISPNDEGGTVNKLSAMSRRFPSEGSLDTRAVIDLQALFYISLCE